MLDINKMQDTLEDIKYLRKSLIDLSREVDSDHPHAKSLLNLRHYLQLRSKDHTILQQKLFFLGLSSLGRSYAHIIASINNIYEQLSSSLGQEIIEQGIPNQSSYITIEEAIESAAENSKVLFGKKSGSMFNKQSTAVMVTLPSNAADNGGVLIKQLADVGVNVFRINTAHDNLEVWQQMADVITDINATREADEKIKIFVDLPGPKIRTGKIRRIEKPIKIGSNKIQKEIFIFPSYANTKGESKDSVTLQIIPAQLAVDDDFFANIIKNEKIKLVNLEAHKAHIVITEIGDGFAKGLIDKKIYIDTKSKLISGLSETGLYNFEDQIDPIRLFIGDILTIIEGDILGSSAEFGEDYKLRYPASIGCEAQGIFASVKMDDRVYIDDGKIALKVLKNSQDTIVCEVISAKPSGTLLKEEKGINFPDTFIQTDALTQADYANAISVLGFADSLSISFCQTAKDVEVLQTLLKANGREDIGIITKIETKAGVKNMPTIIEQLLMSQRFGVMIARGDLAIEIGFDKMAYVQEALLDICDAAHVPVIWATQVLESKMKNNLPSRAEVTDAAMSGRAECVMLNKGAFAIDTIDVLQHILSDMHSISKKNRQLLKKETLFSPF